MKTTDDGEWHDKAPNGMLGGNMEGIEQPEPVDFINPSYTINRYKSYIRENLANHIQASKLRKFMTDFETDERVLNLYDTLGLYDELKSMENQYLQLRYSLPFIPFLESMLNRTADYANSNTSKTADEIKVLRFMYTTISGKISNLRYFRQHVLIVDLLEYLQIVQKNIDKMRETDREVSINEQKKQYEDALMAKVKSALEVVEDDVIPALLEIFNGIMDKIPKLIEQVIKKKEKAEEELQELQNEIKWFKILSGFKVIAKFMEFFGTIGKVVGKAIQAGVAIVDAFRKPLQQLINGVIFLINRLIEFLREKFQTYLVQLKFIYEQIEHIPSKAYDNCREFVLKSIEKIEALLESDSIIDYITNLIEVVRTEVRRLLELAEGQMLLESHEYSGESKKKSTAAKDANDIFDTTTAAFEAVKERNDQLAEYAKQERELEAEVEKWKKRLDDIANKLIPTFVALQQTLINMIKSIDQQTQFDLDISGWKVQSAVGDIKLLFHQMTEGTILRDEMNRQVEKIGETFGVLIKIYDRIQAYMEQAKFAGYIADISSPNSVDIKDKKLKEYVLQLKLLLQTNIVMDQYEIAVHSFKQHQFPFAHIHLATFDLPTGLEANDTKTIVGRTVDEISYLQEQTKFLEISIGKFDREIFGNIDFNSDDGSVAVPFYTFKSREYKKELRRLLGGEEIMIRADIRNAFDQNAVKFNEIGIQLKLVDGTSQSELIDVLENFGVRMTMVGHNHYRCGNKFYYLAVDDNCVIEYSIKRRADGKPMKFNEVYRKLSGKNFFLSPYALWKIKLVKIFDDFQLKNQSAQVTRSPFDQLKKYKGENLDLQIIGRGQYFRADGDFANEVCTDEIAKYYEPDNTITDISVETTKRAYLL